MKYQYYDNKINAEYGNIISNGKYFSDNSYFQNQEHRNKETSQANNREGQAFLENILSQHDGEKRKEIIEDLINDRVLLKRKILSEIENIKDHLRAMKYLNVYRINPLMPIKDLAKLYSDFNHRAVEEEINSWKDISFLRLKLFDEGITGGSNNENA